MVTIHGTYLGTLHSVFVDNVESTIVSSTDTELTIVTPPHAAGTVTVRVYYGLNIEAWLNNAFTYGNAPTITTISPATGSLFGGTSVTITGTDFTDVQSVAFDGVEASFVSSSDTELVVTAPAHAVGMVDVVVTTACGSVTEINGFTYTGSLAAITPTRFDVAMTRSNVGTARVTVGNAGDARKWWSMDDRAILPGALREH